LNKGAEALRGAGVQAAQTVIDKKAEVVITGNIGPNAFNILKASGIRIFQVAPGTKVKQALDSFRKGELLEIYG